MWVELARAHQTEGAFGIGQLDANFDKYISKQRSAEPSTVGYVAPRCTPSAILQGAPALTK